MFSNKSDRVPALSSSPDSRDRAGPHYGRRVQIPRAGYVVIIAFTLLIFLNVAVPKGGIKSSGLPLTWGYVALAIAAITSIPLAIASFRLTRKSAIAGLNYVTVGVLILSKWYNAGQVGPQDIVWMVDLFAIPFSILIVLMAQIDKIPDSYITISIVRCIRLTVIWGLFNFALYALTKNYIEIPYVTINAADAGQIFEKYNSRGELMKLVSTYNNGNIYGDCMVILGPLYLTFEASRFMKSLFIAAVVFTLSRTAWLGLSLILVTMFALGLIHYRRIWLGAIGVAMAILMVFGVLPSMGWTPIDIFDQSLNGRLESLSDIVVSFWGSDHIVINELTYLGIFNSFGIVGSIIVIWAIIFPIVTNIGAVPRMSKLQRSAMAGIGSYVVIATIDGALQFIPVIALFSFVSALSIRPQNLPATPASIARSKGQSGEM